MNLQLAGYRACGKTTVAQQIAQLAGWDWLDTDRLIEDSAGKSIRSIFAADGELVFRDLESQVIEDVAERPRVVIALGGGAVLRPQNRRRLKAGGRAVWLTAAAEQIHRPMSADEASSEQRPALTGQGPLDEIRQVLSEREPIYREFADWIISTEDLEPAEIARRIWEWFQQA